MAKYIDVDKLLEIFEDRFEKICERFGYDHAASGAISGAIKLIRDQPAADVRENIKGEWLIEPGDEWSNYRDYIVCSECGEYGDISWDFCTNCGSDNRGK